MTQILKLSLIRKAILNHFSFSLYPSIHDKLKFCQEFNISLNTLNILLKNERSNIRNSNDFTYLNHNFQNNLDSLSTYDANYASFMDKSNRNKSRSHIWSKEKKALLSDCINKKMPIEEIMKLTQLSRKQIIFFERRNREIKVPITMENKFIIENIIKDDSSLNKSNFVDLQNKTNLSMSQIYRLVHYFRKKSEGKIKLNSEIKSQVIQFLLNEYNNYDKISTHHQDKYNDSNDSNLNYNSTFKWSRELWKKLKTEFPNVEDYSLYRFAYRYFKKNYSNSYDNILNKSSRKINTKRILKLHNLELQEFLFYNPNPTNDQKRELCKHIPCKMIELTKAIEIINSKSQNNQKELIYSYLLNHNFPISLNEEMLNELKKISNLNESQIKKIFEQLKFQPIILNNEHKDLIEKWWRFNLLEKNSLYGGDSINNNNIDNIQIKSISQLAHTLRIPLSNVYQYIYLLNDPDGKLTEQKKIIIKQWKNNLNNKFIESNDIKNLANSLQLSTRQVRRQLNYSKKQIISEDKLKFIHNWMKLNNYRKPTTDEYKQLSIETNLSPRQIYHQIHKIISLE